VRIMGRGCGGRFQPQNAPSGRWPPWRC
jgi:hypothetical protein